MTNPTISIVADSYNSIENAMIQKLFSEGFTFPLEGMITNQTLLPDLITELKNTFNITEYNFSSSASNQYYLLTQEGDFLIVIRSENNKDILVCDMYSKTIELGEKLFGIFKKYEDISSDISIKIVSFSVTLSGQLEKSTTMKNHDDFRLLSKSYYPFLDTDEMFKQYLISNDNLLLLAGSSGTGKTKIVDMLLDFSVKNKELLDIDEEDNTIYVAYVKNPNILSMDIFWNALSKNNFNFVILDDMDHILLDRNISTAKESDETRLRFISNFLSYTDGIFNNNTKFVITTNQSVVDIDSAILRKGRCFDVLSFRALTIEEGENIWIESGLPKEKFSELYKGMNSINAADIGAKIEFEQNLINKNTSVKPSYIKEDGISLYKTNMHKKISI